MPSIVSTEFWLHPITLGCIIFILASQILLVVRQRKIKKLDRHLEMLATIEVMLLGLRTSEESHLHQPQVQEFFTAVREFHSSAKSGKGWERAETRVRAAIKGLPIGPKNIKQHRVVATPRSLR